MSTNDKTTAQIAAIVEPIVAAIEAGIANPGEWVAPWHHVSVDAMSPTCPATERAYTAGNRFVLALFSAATGAPHHWGTFKQWLSLSTDDKPVCVRKGERSRIAILRPAMKKVTDPATGTERDQIIGWRAYPVFHAGQVDGYAMPVVEPREPRHADTVAADIADAYTFAAGIGARVIEQTGDRAYYSPTLDHIVTPDRDQWTDADGAWSTIAHELTHWTGHESRLAREIKNKFGDDAYAAEELVAELGAAFTLAAIGRSAEPRADHAHYLASWLRVLKSNPSHLWTVASHAEKASSYLIEHATIIGRPVAIAA